MPGHLFQRKGAPVLTRFIKSSPTGKVTLRCQLHFQAVTAARARRSTQKWSARDRNATNWYPNCNIPPAATEHPSARRLAMQIELCCRNCFCRFAAPPETGNEEVFDRMFDNGPAYALGDGE